MRPSASLRSVGIILAIFSFSSYCASEIVDEKITVKEEMQPGTVLINVAPILAKNRNDIPGRFFKLLSQKLVLDKGFNKRKAAGEQRWMSVDKETGTITWDRKLDRETECAGSKSCVVKVQAVMMPQRYFSLLNLDVEIEDVNDNAPNFRRFLLPLNVSETADVGTVLNVDQYKARDSDQGDNSVITYELEKNKYFQLSESADETGVTHLLLEVIQPLDYELHKTHQIMLTARDSGRPAKTSQRAVEINVINENDNAPVFLHEEYEVTLREQLPSGHVIARVTALDDDEGEYGSIFYYFPDHDVGLSDTWRNLLRLDNVTGSVTLLQELDREKHDGLRIPIEALDGDAINPKKGHTWLVINVNDVNDNDPTITVNFIVDADGDKAYVSETSPVGTYLAYVITSDADSGDNGKVTTTVQSVKAPGSSKNDGQNNATGQFVMTKEGLITTGRDMDREACNAYKIIITACDMGMPSKCTRKMITIVLMDENEHAPSFEAPTQMVTLREDSEVGTHVTSVTAQDADANNGPALMRTEGGEILPSNYGDVSYSIQGVGSETFTIEPKSGKISLRRRLDRETQPEWRLRVMASDAGYPNGRSSTCEVIIEVDDVNDNAPVFVNPVVNNSLVYASITDDVIAKIQADDADKGHNGEVKYRLMGNEGQDGAQSEPGNMTPGFVVNADTGELSFHEEAEREKLLGEHLLTIKASDSGNPPLQSYLGIRVSVSETPVVVATSPSTREAMSKDFLTLAISLGTATVVLLLIVVIVVLKCKRENKRVRTYRCREAEASKTKSCVACSCDGSSHDDVNDVRSNLTSPSSSSSRPETTTTAPDSSKPGTWRGPNNRCDTDSMFSSSNGSHMAHSDVSGLQGNNCQSSPNERPPISCMVTRLVSPITKTGQSLSSHPDSDSGRGESETDANSYDTHDGAEYATRSLKRSPLTMGADDDVFQRDSEGSALVGLGARCTQQCLEFGHSDLCWMPSPEQRYIGGKRHMSSPTSGYTVPKAGYFSTANQYGAKKCSRLESIRETQPAAARVARLQYHKPSSCSDLHEDEISYRDMLSQASHRMHKRLTNGPYHSSSDVCESCKGGSRTPSTEHLSQVSSACSAPERPSKDRTYRFKHPEYVNAQQARRIKGYKVAPKMSPSHTAPELTDDEQDESSAALITASEAQEIIDDINRLLV